MKLTATDLAQAKPKEKANTPKRPGTLRARLYEEGISEGRYKDVRRRHPNWSVDELVAECHRLRNDAPWRPSSVAKRTGVDVSLICRRMKKYGITAEEAAAMKKMTKAEAGAAGRKALRQGYYRRREDRK